MRGRTNSDYASYYRARYYDVTTGRFLSEDLTGFGDGVNFYRYVHNDPIDSTDSTGFTTYKGFSPGLEVQMRNAVAEALGKLNSSGGSNPPCAGKDAPKIANAIQNGTFVYQPNSKNCGQTGPASVLGFRHVFGIGPLAFGPRCCSLASTRCMRQSTALVPCPTRSQTKSKKIALGVPRNEEKSIRATVRYSLDARRHCLGQVPHGKRQRSWSSRQSSCGNGGCGGGCIGDSQRECVEEYLDI